MCGAPNDQVLNVAPDPTPGSRRYTRIDCGRIARRLPKPLEPAEIGELALAILVVDLLPVSAAQPELRSVEAELSGGDADAGTELILFRAV